VTIPTQALDIVNRLGHFGSIRPKDRTPAQQAAHAKALSRRAAFNLTIPPVPAGTKVMLTDLWKDPDVVADIGGQPFTGFYQFTGSCVGVSTGNAVATLSMVQRKLASGPTKAMIPFWGYDYGTCRGNEGDHGPGEGAIDSVMFKTMIESGVLDSLESGLPQFKKTAADGWQLGQSLEMQWSNPSGPCRQFDAAAKKFPLGGAATLNSTDDIIAAILNGYPVLDGCDDYVGHGAVDSNGVGLGKYDGRGGHSTCFMGAWLHPALGWLLLYSNQWAGSTYPDDGSGKGRCTTWMLKSSVDRLWSLGGGGGETAALSHLTYLPAQPGVIDHFA
jgi:hypothetical protein